MNDLIDRESTGIFFSVHFHYSLTKTILCHNQIRVDPTETVPPVKRQVIISVHHIRKKEKPVKAVRGLRVRKEKKTWGKEK